jgi:hypothetical protein
VPAEVLRPRIPPRLTLDTFDRSAWVSLVPFQVTGTRFRHLPRLPFASAYHELNFRTYVRLGDEPGVWFISMDVTSTLAVLLSRYVFRLPFFRARASVGWQDGAVLSRFHRTDATLPRAHFVASYRPTGAERTTRPGTLEHFLTARYALYASAFGGILIGRVEHEPWPLCDAEAEIEINTITQASGIKLPGVAPHLLYSRGVYNLARPFTFV